MIRNRTVTCGAAFPARSGTAGRILALGWFALAVGDYACATGLTPIANPVVYSDGRPSPSYRMSALDAGEVLHFGNAPGSSDSLGAREALINQIDGRFYLYYDGAGPQGWLANLATSNDLVNWTLKGAVLGLGAAGTNDSASATSPWIIKGDDGTWNMFYLGTPNASAAPDRIPSFPYLTLRATAPSPSGPWTKRYTPVPFGTAPGTYYATTASPGHVLKQGAGYMMFFSSTNAQTKRTIGIARTQSLDTTWTLDASPALPVTEQVENSSLYYEPANQTWFLFTNHIGIQGGVEFTDSIWVYWTKDLNVWNSANKAVVLDGSNCTWSSQCIGMPSVTAVGDKLQIFYDAPGGTSTSHMGRSIGRATLQLPLQTTVDATDVTAPATSSLFPPRAAAGVIPTSNLLVRFNEAVQLGTGNVLVKKSSDGSVVETISTTSGRITVTAATVTIDPVTTLAPSTSYYIEIAPGTIKDLAGNAFAGISGSTTWSFTTGVSNPLPVTVAEASFEGAKSVGGWTGGGAKSGESTASLPSPWTGAGGSAWYASSQYNDPNPDGDIYLYFNGAGTVTQTLAAKVAPYTTYTLTVAVGWRKDLAANPSYSTFPGYKIELLSGSTVIGSNADTSHGGYGSAPVAGKWKDVTITCTTTESPPLAPLGIRISGYGIQTNYDNVRLTADAWTPPNDFQAYISKPAFDLTLAQRDFNADPDGDGLPNGLEAWFGTNPAAAAGSGIKAIPASGGSFAFSHPQNTTPPVDLTASYEWSPDLLHWYATNGVDGPAGGPTVVISRVTNAGVTSVTATPSIPAPRMFLRVRVAKSN